MITGFETLTAELTPTERDKILPNVVLILTHRLGVDLAITNGYIIDKLRYLDQRTTAPRLRKIIHCIRITGRLQRLIATSKGYYIANTVKEIEDYVESLHRRSQSITDIANQLEFQLKEFIKAGAV